MYAYEFMCTRCMQVPGPEESIRSLGTGVTGATQCGPKRGPVSSARAQVIITAEPSLEPWGHIFSVNLLRQDSAFVRLLERVRAFCCV